jgi:hypothetical protein
MSRMLFYSHLLVTTTLATAYWKWNTFENNLIFLLYIMLFYISGWVFSYQQCRQ